MKKIFIDGSAGTTGLRIAERLEGRTDISIIKLTEENRKDPNARRDAINSADIAFLCLPDDAAREAVSLVESEDTVIIDTSTAHRTSDGWTYGFPEIHGLREEIKTSKRIANPGCYASGFISLIAPLVEKGIIDKNASLSAFGISGYSGGGKKMIGQYEREDRPETLSSPGIYGLTLKHKHLPEMQKMTGLTYPPVFMPVVDDYYKGMASTIMLQSRLLNGQPGAEEICEKLQEYYKDEHFVSVVPFTEHGNTLYANELAGTNYLKIIVCGNEESISVTSVFDNLGKGASGAAVQNMNIMLGLDEAAGLETAAGQR